MTDLKAFTARTKKGDCCLVVAPNMDAAVAAVKKKYSSATVSSISLMEDYSGPGRSEAMPVVLASDDKKE